MNRYALSLLVCLSTGAFAQSFSVGTRTVTFFDPDRNRDIPTSVRYPAATQGNNVPVAPGQFPVIAIGHGFNMETGAYANLWEYFVPRGYILALPNTEGGFGVDHGDFGLDLAFVAQALQNANADPESPFFGAVMPSAALMGHSMGGGAATLGAAGNGNIRTLVTLAAAETDPSAVAAAAAVEVPTLMFAGGNDCVTPIPEHQGPIFGAIGASCKAFVNILGGGHCYFANSNFNCNFGELFCSPSPTISRAQQQAVVNEFTILWMDHFLKDDEDAFLAVQDSILLSARVAGDLMCLSTEVVRHGASSLRVYPNPADQFIFVDGLEAHSAFRIHDIHGRTVAKGSLMYGERRIPLDGLAAGTYHLAVEGRDATISMPFIISR